MGDIPSHSTFPSLLTMSLKQLASKAGLIAGLTGAAAMGTVAYCADDKDKYFDPEALERGAKALREIQSSPFAKKVPNACRTETWCLNRCLHVPLHYQHCPLRWFVGACRCVCMPIRAACHGDSGV